MLPSLQFGFRKAKSTMSAIFTLKKLMSDRLVSMKKAFACFIDLKRAFDNVDRGLLFNKLHSLGINRHFSNVESLLQQFGNVC